MDESPNLELPLVPIGQAGGHILHNEAANRVERFSFLSVKSRTVSAQPANPENGDAYILPVGATGDDWSGGGQSIAIFYEGWVENDSGQFLLPVNGMTVYVEDEDLFLTRVRGYWIPWDEHIVKPSDTARSTETLAADPHLTVSLKKNTTYVFQLLLFVTGGAVGDFKGSMEFGSLGASPSFVYCMFVPAGGGTQAVRISADVADFAMVGTTFPGQAVSIGIRGSIVVDANNGDFYLQWARDHASVSPTTVRAGSFMTVNLAAV